MRVWAVGGSVTANYGGCFGEGCSKDALTAPNRLRPTQLQPSGFLSSFMRWVNDSAPGNHALFNRAVGGTGPEWLLECSRSVIAADADVVIVDYALNGAGVVQHLRLIRTLRMITNATIVVIANFFWCRSADGGSAQDVRRSMDGTPVRDRLRHAIEQCHSGDDVQKFRAVHEQPKHTSALRSLQRACEACRVPVLSAYDALAPRVRAGRLRISEISGDGWHPTRRHEAAILSRTLSELLIQWFNQSVPVDPSTPRSGTRAAGPDVGIRPRRTPAACSASSLSSPLWRSCYGAASYLRAPRLRLGSWQYEAAVPRHLLARGVRANTSAAAQAQLAAWSAKPGWVSTAPADPTAPAARARPGDRPGDRPGPMRAPLEIEVTERGRLAVSLYLLHTYENAGLVQISCAGCTCPSIDHDTRWTRPSSGDAAVLVQLEAPAESRRCLLRVAHAERRAGERVKVTALAVTELRPKAKGVREALRPQRIG